MTIRLLQRCSKSMSSSSMMSWGWKLNLKLRPSYGATDTSLLCYSKRNQGLQSSSIYFNIGSRSRWKRVSTISRSTLTHTTSMMLISIKTQITLRCSSWGLSKHSHYLNSQTMMVVRKPCFKQSLTWSKTNCFSLKRVRLISLPSNWLRIIHSCNTWKVREIKSCCITHRRRKSQSWDSWQLFRDRIFSKTQDRKKKNEINVILEIILINDF